MQRTKVYEMDKAITRWELRGGFIGVFLCFVAIVIVAPLFARGYYAHTLLQMCLNLLLLVTINALSRRWYTLLTGLALTILVAIFDFMGLKDDSLVYIAYGQFFICLFFVLVIGFLSLKIFNESLINANLIFGALTIYLVAGMLWSKLYWLVDVLYPGSFGGVESLSFDTVNFDKVFRHEFDLRYFSYTVLSTVGFGDIVPSHHLAKSLTLLEAMFGQLFVAIAIAKMVGIWRRKGQV